jgi:hypothetical protein
MTLVYISGRKLDHLRPPRCPQRIEASLLRQEFFSMTISGRALCLRIELLAHAPRAITRMEIITTMNKKPFPVRPAGPYKPVRYLSVSAVLKGHHPEWLDEGSPGTLWDVSKHLPTLCRPNKADIDSNRAIEPNFLILQSPAAARFLGPQEPRKEVVVSDEERRIRS